MNLRNRKLHLFSYWLSKHQFWRIWASTYESRRKNSKLSWTSKHHVKDGHIRNCPFQFFKPLYSFKIENFKGLVTQKLPIQFTWPTTITTNNKTIADKTKVLKKKLIIYHGRNIINSDKMGGEGVSNRRTYKRNIGSFPKRIDLRKNKCFTGKAKASQS